jgi:BON domain-containing protein
VQNLLQVLATVAPAQTAPAQTDDAAIHDAITAEIEKIAGLPSPIMNNVTVSNGIVHLWGYVGSENERRALRIAAERVRGVKEVRDHRADLFRPVYRPQGNAVRTNGSGGAGRDRRAGRCLQLPGLSGTERPLSEPPDGLGYGRAGRVLAVGAPWDGRPLSILRGHSLSIRGMAEVDPLRSLVPAAESGC